MRTRSIVLACILFALSQSISAAEPASNAPNTWVQLSDEKDNCKYASSIWYVSATDEFLLWGASGEPNHFAKRYDLESFDLASRKWQDSLPKGKEQSWANGRFPNWVWYGQTASGDGSLMVKGAADWIVRGNATPNKVDFVEADGIQRPTRCPVFHQATYDSKRQRMLYFVGGKTFSYSVKERAWQDLKPQKVPLGCEALVWATLCYDPLNDEAVLFGGGMALNPWGGAKTWIYDCAKNEWRRPELKIEPPLRCNSRMVFDSKNKLIVLFGGDDQTKALNDTWVYNPAKREWSERKPAIAPPGAFVCASTFLEKHGVILICAADGDAKVCSTWIYDAATNVWTPVKGTVPAMEWVSCDYSTKDDTVVLVTACTFCYGSPLKTYAYRFDPATAVDKRTGVPPGTPIYKHAEQHKSLALAPAGDRAATEAALKALPVNQWVDANPPGTVTNKTWSDCTIDTDTGVILYVGGGHSGYSGGDVAHYDVGTNRWSTVYEPEFAPFLESAQQSLFGWSYNLHPWSEHTRRYYAYDPVSKTMVYARQCCELKGHTLYLGKDGTKEVKPGIAETWIYDPKKKKFFEPTFDRTFPTDFATCLVTTPKGVYALSGGKLWLCKVTREGKGEDETCVGLWNVVSDKAPTAANELDPTVYDSKRNRLVSMVTKGGQPEMWFFDLNSNAWTKGACKGAWQTTREAVYIPDQDVIFQITFTTRDNSSNTPSVQQIYRCASDDWIQADIALPTKGHRPACWDTSLCYDPVHKVVVMIDGLGFASAATTFLLRYDDKGAKIASTH